MMAPEMQLAGRQLGGEELGLAQRRGLEGGDHHEGGPPVGQQPGHRLRPVHESLVHGLEEDEELRDVGQELGPEDPVRHGVERLGRRVHQTRPVGGDEPAQQAGREEVGQALRRIEEVQGVAGRRRVDHDQVVLALGVDLVEPLHGDVVVGLHEPSRDVLVERVGQDLLPSRRRRARAGRTRSSQLCLVSSMAAHSSPRGVTPACLNTSSEMRTSWLPIPFSPSASASRRAGSTVSTRTRPPCSAAAMAPTAAAVVVLPTPPGPQAMTISLAESRWPIVGGASAARRGAISTPAPRPGPGPSGGSCADRGCG